MKSMSPAAASRAATLVLFATLASCGGSEPPAVSPNQEASNKDAAPRRKKQQLSVSGQLGSLEEGKVDDTFNRLMPQFGSCLSQASSRVEFIGGHVKFFIRISLEGSAKWAYLSESTIGDRDAERCMLSAAKAVRWPQPLEGEGQAQKAFDFDPSPDVRDAVPWGADRITKALVS